jgi:hypothetical protein
MLHLPKPMPMYLQMAWARGSLAVPLKTFTNYYLSVVKQENRRSGGRNCEMTLASTPGGASGNWAQIAPPPRNAGFSRQRYHFRCPAA